MKKLVFGFAAFAMLALFSCKECVDCTDCAMAGVGGVDGGTEGELCEKDFNSKTEYEASVETAETLLGCTCK